MKISELFEGKFVEPFNKNGKPNPNHPAYEKNKAKYDAEQKALKAGDRAAKRADTAAEKAKKLENALESCSVVLGTTDGWGELDSTDIVKLKVIPALKKRIKANPEKYSEDFKDAVFSTDREFGDFMKLYGYFDKAVKKHEHCKNFNAWVDQTEAGYKELMNS